MPKFEAIRFCEELQENVLEHRDVVDRLKQSVAELRGCGDLQGHMTRPAELLQSFSKCRII